MANNLLLLQQQQNRIPSERKKQQQQNRTNNEHGGRHHHHTLRNKKCSLFFLSLFIILEFFHNNQCRYFAMATTTIQQDEDDDDIPNFFNDGNNYEWNPQLKHRIQSLQDTKWYRFLLNESIQRQRQRKQRKQRRQQQTTTTEFECSSPMTNYAEELANEMGSYSFSILVRNNLMLLPYIYKHYVDQSEDAEYFGFHGEYTEELLLRQEQNEVFWGISNDNDDNVLLLGMHGEDLKSDSKLISTIQMAYADMTELRAITIADQIKEFISTIPEQFNNPLLTMNAVATEQGSLEDDDDDDEKELYPNSITIGDGILHFLAEHELHIHGPEFIHAHEFGHHLQFQASILNVDDYVDGAGNSRRAELMADAFASFFLSHPHHQTHDNNDNNNAGNNGDKGSGSGSGGEALSIQQIMELQRTAFSLGDCEVGESGHHGTPKQRSCAAEWGVNLVLSSSSGSTFSSSSSQTTWSAVELGDSFDAALTYILDVDSNLCPKSQNISIVKKSDDLPQQPPPPPPPPEESTQKPLTSAATTTLQQYHFYTVNLWIISSLFVLLFW